MCFLLGLLVLDKTIVSWIRLLLFAMAVENGRGSVEEDADREERLLFKVRGRSLYIGSMLKS